MNTDEAGARQHWVVIRVKSHTDIVESLKWDGLSFAVRTKWNWYFRYRAALLQVKYPRHEVVMQWGNSPAEGIILANFKKNKLAAARAQVNKWENLLQKARDNWSEMFPIEDDPGYQKAKRKVLAKKFELKQLEEGQ